MNINQAYRSGIEKLKSAGIEAPAREAGAFLCHVLKIDYSALFTHHDLVPDQQLLDLYFNMIEKRCTRVPFQHITGFQEFMSLQFTVNRHTLIPRADTEILVETIINKTKPENKSGHLDDQLTIRILDIGTGSGCIGISLASYIKNTYVTAVDISTEALKVAEINAGINKVSDRIRFINLDILSPFDHQIFKEPFEIIVSNPPYIPIKDISTLQPEVAIHEPLNALDGGLDGLDFYRAIVNKSPALLASGGRLAFEVGINQSDDVKNLMEIEFRDLEIIPDLAGIPRVVTGVLK